MSPARRKVHCFALALLPLLFGCSAFMVLFKPGVRDLSVLEPGTPRWEVIHELGRPVRSGVPQDCPDDIVFPEGYSPGEKAIFVPLILVFDFFTMGLAEAQLFEHELKRGTPRAGILVLYDEQRRVESACIYQGHGQVGSREGAPPPCPDWLIQLSECLEERAGSDQME